MADVAALEGDLARGRLEEAGQQSGRRALAAPGLTDDGERLSPLDREVQPVHRLNGTYLPAQNPGADRKVLDQPFDNDQVRVLLGARRRRLLRGRGHSFGAISCSQICLAVGLGQMAGHGVARFDGSQFGTHFLAADPRCARRTRSEDGTGSRAAH